MKFLVEFSLEELDLLGAALSFHRDERALPAAGHEDPSKRTRLLTEAQIAAVPVHDAIFQKIDDVLKTPNNKLEHMCAIYNAALAWRRRVKLAPATPYTQDLIVTIDAAIAAEEHG